MNDTLIFLGTGHGDPNFRRNCSGILLCCNDDTRRYLIDAGDGTATRLFRCGIQPASLNAIFISHLHEDHTSGMVSVIKASVKHRHSFPEKRLQVWLPEAKAVPALEIWMDALRIPFRNNSTELFSYTPGLFFQDDALQCTACATNHNPPGKSNALFLKTRCSSIVITGDLSADFHDFPIEEINNLKQAPDIVLCELTHYKPEYAMPLLRQLHTEKLIFTHVYDSWDEAENRLALLKMCSTLPYPVEIAEDNAKCTLN